MGLSTKFAALIAAYGMLASVAQADSTDPAPPKVPDANNCDVNSGPFATLSNMGVGIDNQHNGVKSCSVSWVYNQVVTGVEVWSDDYRVKGVKIYYNGDVQPYLFGTMQSSNQGHNDRYDKITWNAGDLVTKIGYANNADNTGIGGIHIEVAGHTLSVGHVATSVNAGVKGWDFNWVGNPGLLLGASGMSDGQSLGGWWPLFLAPGLSKGKLIAMTLDTPVDQLNSANPPQNTTTDEVYIRNTNAPGGGNQSWTYTGKTSLTSTTSTANMQGSSGGMTYSVKTGLTVGVPEIAQITGEVGVEGKWELQKSSTDTWGTTLTHESSFTQGSAIQESTIAPGKAMHCSSVLFTGDYDMGYLGYYQATWNGKTFYYMEHGTFKHNHNSQSFSGCGLVDISSIPGGAKVLNAPDTTSGTTTAGKRAIKVTW